MADKPTTPTDINSKTEQEIHSLMHQDAGDRVIADAVRSTPLPALHPDFALNLAKLVEPPPVPVHTVLIPIIMVLALVFGGFGYLSINLDNPTTIEPFDFSLPLVLTFLSISVLFHISDWRDRTRFLDRLRQAPLI